MKTKRYALYVALMLFITVSANAAPTANVNPVSMAMFIYIPSALMALVVTYFIWRVNASKRKQNTPKPANRGPVKRPVVAYHRRRTATEV